MRNGTGGRVDEIRWLIVTARLLVMIATTVDAKDTRQGTEPKIPASCTQLRRNFVSQTEFVTESVTETVSFACTPTTIVVASFMR